MGTPTLNTAPIYQVQDGLTMWSCTTWQEGEIERNPELRGARALQAMEGWPEQVRNGMFVSATPAKYQETGNTD